MAWHCLHFMQCPLVANTNACWSIGHPVLTIRVVSITALRFYVLSALKIKQFYITHAFLEHIYFCHFELIILQLYSLMLNDDVLPNKVMNYQT